MASRSIRRATPDDAVAVARVHIESWRAAYRGLVPDSRLDGLDWGARAERLRKHLAEDPAETYVADQEGQILGFVTLGTCRDEDVDAQATGEIWGIYLAPQFWRQGTGTLLCRHAEEVLRSRGYGDARLWVLAGNSAARRFYEAMGFEADGASKVLDLGAPLEAVRYQKRLAREEAEGAMEDYAWSVHVCDGPQAIAETEAGLATLLDGLGRNILKHLGPVELGRSIRLFLRDAGGKVVGGAIGELFGGWLFITLLWVEESLRNRGLGTELTRRLEEEAARLGCKHAHVDTYSFEARPFYERLGYELFATLEDYPEGYSKYYLKKALRPPRRQDPKGLRDP